MAVLFLSLVRLFTVFGRELVLSGCGHAVAGLSCVEFREDAPRHSDSPLLFFFFF